MTTPYVPPPREIHIPPWLIEQWENPIPPQPPPPPPITAADLAEAAANREAERTNWHPTPTIPAPQGEAPPTPTQQPPWRNLPATARPEVPKPSKDFTFKGLRIVWDGVKWIAKNNPYVRGAWFALEAYDAIVTTTDLAKWAGGILPSYKPPPQVDTRYVFSGGGMGMTYKHFDGSWQSFPPPGYDRFGALIR